MIITWEKLSAYGACYLGKKAFSDAMNSKPFNSRRKSDIYKLCRYCPTMFGNVNQKMLDYIYWAIDLMYYELSTPFVNRFYTKSGWKIVKPNELAEWLYYHLNKEDKK